MKALLKELPSLHRALIATLGPTPTVVSADLVDAYIRAIQRKCSFASQHLCVLNGINWESVQDLGRANADVTRLAVTIEDGLLELRHPTAVSDHVYLAFDGVIAAVANMTDTYGRLINAVYGLGIKQRKASLLAVRDRCTTTSALGRILHDPQHTEWLKKVKEVRGQCQHEDVEDVLLSPRDVFARRSQPFVPQSFCWLTPPVDMPVSVFAQKAADSVVSTLVAATRAVVANAADPVT